MRLNILAICLLIARCGMTPVYAERLTTELSECETLLTDAADLVVDQRAKIAEQRQTIESLMNEPVISSTECERVVRETGETVAAEAEKRHEEIVAVLNRRCLWTRVGVGAAGAVVGFIAGLIVGALL